MPNIETEVFILTAGHFKQGEKSYIALWGASAAGPLEIFHEFNPYFFVDAAVSPEKSPALRGAQAGEETLKSLSGVPVRKWLFTSVETAEKARRWLLESKVRIFESDLRPRERFLMDLGINGGAKVAGDAEQRGAFLRFYNPSLTPAQVQVALTVCSLDIETSISSGALLSIAVHLSGGGRNERRVFMRGMAPAVAPAATSFFAGEKELLNAFESWFCAADPDIVIGWNVIGFDLTFLKNRAAALGLPLRLGRGGRAFSVSEDPARFSRANVAGRVVLDGPQLLRSSFFSFESYSLENVARKVLGEGKLIGPGGNRALEIERLFKEDQAALAEYNLQDAVLVTRIFDKLELLNLTARRTELSGMLLDQVGYSTASFDHFYLPRLHAEKFVAPDIGDTGEYELSPGGHVMNPVAGIYENIISLDFQSLYPSIIRTFNIDPLSRACAESDPLKTPAGYKFSRSRAILPEFIGRLMAERRKARENGNKALSQAIKILMNSFYGVMGSAGSRLYHPALPAAITSTGQWLLMESKRWLEEQGNTVIYGDTDSLFVKAGPVKGPAADFEAIGAGLAGTVTGYWTGRLSREFGVSSQLKLEFKKHYTKFLVPSARQTTGGAKKRYAGLVTEKGQEKIEFVGLEVVRSDWTQLAREFQRELCDRVFHNESIEDWLRRFVARVRAGEFDKLLVYRKRLHKPPGEYGESPPPYVRAALLLPRPGRDVRYIMTKKGPVPVELDPSEPDYEHYVTRQLRPIADSILELLGTSFDQIMSPQLRLF